MRFVFIASFLPIGRWLPRFSERGFIESGLCKFEFSLSVHFTCVRGLHHGGHRQEEQQRQPSHGVRLHLASLRLSISRVQFFFDDLDLLLETDAQGMLLRVRPQFIQLVLQFGDRTENFGASYSHHHHHLA